MSAFAKRAHAESAPAEKARRALPLVADVVEAWAPTGGGIRSYIEAKAHAWTSRGSPATSSWCPDPPTG
jgi:hypothetical protein